MKSIDQAKEMKKRFLIMKGRNFHVIKIQANLKLSGVKKIFRNFSVKRWMQERERVGTVDADDA